MRPTISNTPYYKLSIPELSGGINLRDNISLVNDNQLTDVKNMWYRDGTLKTRPAAVSKEAVGPMNTLHIDSDAKIYANENNYRVIGGVTYLLVCIQTADALDFRYYKCVEGIDYDGYIRVAMITTDNLPPADFTCNIFQYGSDIYCFCSGYYSEESTPYYIYKISEVGTDAAPIAFEWKRVGVDEDLMPYVPLVYHNAAPTMSGWESLSEVSSVHGYNLIGNKCRILYDMARQDKESGPMFYPLPFYIHKPPTSTGLNWNENFVGREFIVKYTDAKGDVYTHSLTIKKTGELDNWGTESEESDSYPDNLKLHASNNYFFFTAADFDFSELPPNTSTTEIYSTWKSADYIPNNMEVITPCPNPAENYEKVLNMSFNEWYGGGSEGLYGGIHLFMGGNKGDEKSLVCWSDFNKPLYFSENCYAYVGDKAQSVTAFGKQGESLMIFKEREVYATQYTKRDSITEEEITNQSVIDVAANEVYFPMIQVHGFIGCDCPDSVQLCRNRLVWAHSDGKVYTLTSANQYSERSIFEVSGMVENRLKQHGAEKLIAAKSCDWNGHYVLSVGDEILLMDYNSYGYSNVYSYSKSEDAQKLIPWWIWDVPKYSKSGYVNIALEWVTTNGCPVKIKALASVGDLLFIIAETEVESIQGTRVSFIEMLYLTDNEQYDKIHEISTRGPYGEDSSISEAIPNNIPTMLQTKFFDFGAPTTKKNVPKIEVTLGANGGTPIKTVVIDERSETESEFVIDEPSQESRSAAYFHNKLIRASNKHPYRIGIRFECENGMSVDSVTLLYKQLRGLK